MIRLVREWLRCGSNTTQASNVRPANNTWLYDGAIVMIVQWYEDGTVDVVHEDDRLNVRYRVLMDWLK